VEEKYLLWHQTIFILLITSINFTYTMISPTQPRHQILIINSSATKSWCKINLSKTSFPVKFLRHLSLPKISQRKGLSSFNFWYLMIINQKQIFNTAALILKSLPSSTHEWFQNFHKYTLIIKLRLIRLM